MYCRYLLYSWDDLMWRLWMNYRAEVLLVCVSVACVCPGWRAALSSGAWRLFCRCAASACSLHIDCRILQFGLCVCECAEVNHRADLCVSHSAVSVHTYVWFTCASRCLQTSGSIWTICVLQKCIFKRICICYLLVSLK